jgi:hypothetical protein
MYTAFEKSIFVEAKKLGIHRTVHAGEGGPAANVISVRKHYLMGLLMKFFSTKLFSKKL